MKIQGSYVVLEALVFFFGAGQKLVLRQELPAARCPWAGLAEEGDGEGEGTLLPAALLPFASKRITESPNFYFFNMQGNHQHNRSLGCPACLRFLCKGDAGSTATRCPPSIPVLLGRVLALGELHLLPSEGWGRVPPPSPRVPGGSPSPHLCCGKGAREAHKLLIAGTS